MNPGSEMCAASLLRVGGYSQISDPKPNLDQGRAKAPRPIRLTTPHLTSGLIRARACCRIARASARLAGLLDFARELRSCQVPTGSEALARAFRISRSRGCVGRGRAT
jgi:hypothetical protein